MKAKTGPRVLLAVLLGVGLAAGCSSSGSDAKDPKEGKRASVARKHHPILLIGLDGLELDVVLPMLAEGRLPVLGGLMKEGSFGELSTTRPTASPIIWTSIATGKTAKKHGIHGFLHRDPADPKYRQLYTGGDRRTKAFWNILSELGLRVTVVGWWMTFPVEEINGVMVAQVNTSTPERNQAGKGIWKGSLVEGLPGQVHPPQRQAEFLAAVPEVEKELPELTHRIFGSFSGPLSPVAAKLWEACHWSFRADATYRRIGLKLMKEDDSYDVLAIYFGGTDVLGHRFWRYLRPELYRVKPTEQEMGDLANIVRDYYTYMDSVVGEMVEAAPADSVVIVVSDHGMKPINTATEFVADMRTKELNSGGHGDAPPGIFMACGPNIRKLDLGKPITELTREDLPKVGSIFDVLPTLFRLLKIPSARDMDGSVMEEIIEPDYLARSQIPLVDTYTPPNWHRDRVKSNVQSVNLQERLEQLRTLGYIAEEGEEEPAEYNVIPSSDYDVDEYGG